MAEQHTKHVSDITKRAQIRIIDLMSLPKGWECTIHLWSPGPWGVRVADISYAEHGKVVSLNSQNDHSPSTCQLLFVVERWIVERVYAEEFGDQYEDSDEMLAYILASQ